MWKYGNELKLKLGKWFWTTEGLPESQKSVQSYCQRYVNVIHQGQTFSHWLRNIFLLLDWLFVQLLWCAKTDPTKHVLLQSCVCGIFSNSVSLLVLIWLISLKFVVVFAKLLVWFVAIIPLAIGLEHDVCLTFSLTSFFSISFP